MSRKKTNDDFLKELYEINQNIEPLDSYIDAITKIRVRCKIDEHIWSPTPHRLLHGASCPKCAGNAKRTHDDFIKELFLINPNIKINERYINNKTKLDCDCLICGCNWKASPDTLLNGNGCPKCGLKQRIKAQTRTQQEFIKLVKTMHPDIEIVGNYTGARYRVLCKCKKCNYEWTPYADSLIRGHGCCRCNVKNIFEKSTETFLIKHKISFVCQKKFDNLYGVGGRQLSYDYYLPIKNVLIEMQGQQHEQPVEYFGGEERFKIQQEHDKRKREYAKEHGIELLEINYNDRNKVDDILYNFLIA